MYTPPFNVVSDEADVRAMVTAARTAWLVTTGEDGVPMATSVPVMWRGQKVIAHVAKANSHWKQIIDGTPALLIVGGAQAYISPSWYAAKAEHGKVVPTWNYSAVHLTGTVTVHHDREWLRAAVTELTDTYEGGRDQPWQVTDAPAQYIDGQLGGIVGIEVTVTRVEGKAKLSQNRSEADRQGVVDGLRAEDLSDADHAQALEVAERMADILRASRVE
ncbi:FMN-binding negative transcriptional regulator [Leekyejoonella antrihumi]|uniref:FMN-binding negative transcriptional regulator n=1 Tax=Leekyejoonella antrihumi TaxID=1660198 RepID=A0A563E7Y6_9MICO|nr:FMN-binding negative transcriptional regulator [Leekyejoonella antrihumi]TWP38640.1 FMN-binding negative transcriptional regulator [Leekyejoonella antrihumi]